MVADFLPLDAVGSCSNSIGADKDDAAEEASVDEEDALVRVVLDVRILATYYSTVLGDAFWGGIL